MRRLTFGGKNRFPIWSADGQRVAFQSDREGDLGIFWQRADGSGAAERLTKPDQGVSHVPESWSPNGERFLFGVTKGSSVSLWSFSTAGQEGRSVRGVQSPNPINAAFSPDGRWVAYTVARRSESRGFTCSRSPPPEPGTRSRKASAIHSGVVARRTRARVPATGRPMGRPDHHDPTELCVQRSAADAAGGAQYVRARLPPEELRHDAGWPDSGRCRRRTIPVRGSATPQIQVVLNWFEELKARVPAK